MERSETPGMEHATGPSSEGVQQRNVPDSSANRSLVAPVALVVLFRLMLFRVIFSACSAIPEQKHRRAS
jgi:hypothetical protein